MNTNPCEHCHNIHIYTQGSSPKPNTQMIGINGTIMFYKNGFKKYVKPCCLMAYYVGRDMLGNYMINQTFATIVKPKAPKYVITAHDAFPVHEMSYCTQETIRNPASSNVNDKLQINRCMNMQEYPLEYTLATKAAYNKQLKQIEPQDVDMDVEVQKPTVNKPQYVYLIQERTAAVANQPIYKIGRTEQPNFDRFKGYVKGYKVLLHLACSDCKVAEKLIMDHFKSKYRHAVEYGNEYFEGDYKKMIINITNIVFG